MTSAESASLELFESLANIGAWLVIVGVIGEGIEIALKIGEHKSKNEKFLEWYKNHNFCIEIVGAIFWIIVVVGLVMELRYSGKSQLIVKKENSRITRQAGDAFKKAGDSGLLAAQIGTTNAQLSLRIEELRKANDEFEAKLKHRVITKKQEQDFIHFSDAFISYNHEQKGEVFVTTVSWDNETMLYAKQIREMLDAAGYKSEQFPDVIIEPPGDAIRITNHTDANVVMTVHDHDKEPPYALAIRRSFEFAGIKLANAIWDRQSSTNQPQVVITVIDRN